LIFGQAGDNFSKQTNIILGFDNGTIKTFLKRSEQLTRKWTNLVKECDFLALSCHLQSNQGT
jgi:hypothetical protein